MSRDEFIAVAVFKCCAKLIYRQISAVAKTQKVSQMFTGTALWPTQNITSQTERCLLKFSKIIALIVVLVNGAFVLLRMC